MKFVKRTLFKPILVMILLISHLQGGEITIVEDKYLKDSPRFSYSYTLSKSTCTISYDVSGERGKQNWWLRLRYHWQEGENEYPDFQSQLSLHHALLKTIFKKYSAKNMTSLLTPGLSRLQRDRSWSVKVAKLAIQNKDWLDFTQNYPKHKSKKSSNQILKELLNIHRVQEPLFQLFKKYGVLLNLNHVEKVFAERLHKLKFKDQLKDIKFKNSIMYDAGMFSYKASPLP